MTVGRTESLDPASEARRHFVYEVASRAPLPPHITVEAATAAVMCAVTERLTKGEAHVLLEALPEPVRAMFDRCVEHREGPVSAMHRPELLERTAEHLGVTPMHAEAICRAVLSAIRDELPPEIAEHVAVQLPGDLKELWCSEPPTAATPIVAPTEPEMLRTQVLAAIEREAGALPPGIDGVAAFMAVMCIFSQRLSGGEARHVFLALPNTLRSLVTYCMLHRDEPAEAFDGPEFLRRVSAHLNTDRETSERVVSAVFDAVKRCLPLKDIEDAGSQLPPDIRGLWLGA